MATRARRPKQIRITHPTRRVRTDRLTARQLTVLRLLRRAGPLSVAEVAQLAGYDDASAALRRLLDRRLVRRVRTGVYAARPVGERVRRPPASPPPRSGSARTRPGS